MRRAGTWALATAFGGLGAAVAFWPIRRAEGQRFEPARPATVTVGLAAGATPMARVDAARTGFVRGPLPEGALRIGWQASPFPELAAPSLVGEGDEIALVSTLGQVTLLDGRGIETAKTSPLGATRGDAARTSNGTIVFATEASTAFGVRQGKVVFRTPVGAPPAPKSAPVALPDGGVVLPLERALVVLDGDGNVRARVSLIESPSLPLVAHDGVVYAVGAGHVVHAWPVGGEVRRVGRFQEAPTSLVALSSRALLGVFAQGFASVLDPRTGAVTNFLPRPPGRYVGLPAATPEHLTLTLDEPSASSLVVVDARGTELRRAVIATRLAPPDAGSPPEAAVSAVAPLVDARGNVAFVTAANVVGVAHPDGTVAWASEHPPCSEPPGQASVVGLSPLAERAFLVTCRNGRVLRVEAAP